MFLHKHDNDKRDNNFYGQSFLEHNLLTLRNVHVSKTELKQLFLHKHDKREQSLAMIS